MSTEGPDLISSIAVNEGSGGVGTVVLGSSVSTPEWEIRDGSLCPRDVPTSSGLECDSLDEL